MPKPLVFISHITEEKPIAVALKGLVQDAFLDLLDVFVSSDGESIRPGDRWLDNISHGLQTCAIEFVVCSNQSIKRPWINFEAGAGWVRGIPVIPICHSGMTFKELPPPLNALQVVSATNEDQLRLVLPIVAGAINSRTPNVDLTGFMDAVRAFEDAYVFWDVLKRHAHTFASNYDGTGSELLAGLRLVTLGGKPFETTAGGTPGMCLRLRGDLPGEIKEAIEFFKNQELFRINVLNSMLAMSSIQAVRINSVELQPLSRFMKVFSDPRALM